MNDDQKKEVIEQKEVPVNAYSGTTVAFIFTTLCFLFWGNLLGFFGEGAGLAIGTIQLGVFVSYHLAASKIFSRGDGFEGNVFLVFATFFGGVGGLTNIMSALSAFFGIGFDNTVVGYAWILCGIFLLGILPSCIKAPWSAFVMYTLAGIGVLMMGFVTIGILGASFGIIIAWLLFGVGCLGLYMTLAGMNGFNGIEFPLGKPIGEFSKQAVKKDSVILQ